jgi:Gpi18-like mannosyltransferase
MNVAILYVSLRLANFLAFFTYMRVQHRSWSHVFYRWDSQWYESVASHGYHYVVQDQGRTLSNEAFFPLFPFLERLISQVTTLSYIDSGIAISLVSGVVAALMIYKTISLFASEKVAQVSVALWALLPMSFIQILSYSETLFTALCASSLYFTVKKKFLLAAILSAFAGLTRPSGLAIASAVIIAIFLDLRKSRATLDWKKIVAIFLAPLGWISFLAYLAFKHHNPFAYFVIQRDWNNGFDGGSNFLSWIWRIAQNNIFEGGAIAFGALAVIALLWGLIRSKPPIEFVIYTAAIVFVSFTTSGYFGSKPRYLMPAYPLLIPISLWLVRQSPFRKKLFLSLFGALGIVVSVLTLAGNGPP